MFYYIGIKSNGFYVVGILIGLWLDRHDSRIIGRNFSLRQVSNSATGTLTLDSPEKEEEIYITMLVDSSILWK